MVRWISAVGVACAVALAGCSGGASGSGASPAPVVASSEAPSPAPATSSSPAVPVTEQPSRDFLAVVCYTDTALQNLIGAATAAGGWGSLSGNDAQRYAQAAVEAAREAVRKIQATTWPDTISGQMDKVSQEYLAMLRPLETIQQSRDAAARSGAWRDLKAQDRTGEEQVRLTLKLGPVDSANDGCPPPIEIKVPKPTSSSAATGSGTAASGAWTQHWTSPSGNIQCGYAPSGSRGQPVVACVVADQSTYVKLTQGIGAEGPLSASSSTFDQLSSGSASILGYGQSMSVGPFMCQQSDETGVGMACWLPGTEQGFAVKRDSYLVR